MNNHMSLWDQVKTTDPDMTDRVNFGAFKFTTIDAQYQVMKATEAFGPCGIGWGLRNQSFDVIVANPAEPNNNLLCFTATLWYTWGGQAGELEIAADIELFEYSNKNSKWGRVADPVKKVRTAALSKGLSWLGFSADVFLGNFDDARYVSDLKKAKQAGKLGRVQTPDDPQVPSNPDAASPEQQAQIQAICADLGMSGKDLGAWLQPYGWTWKTLTQAQAAETIAMLTTEEGEVEPEAAADPQAAEQLAILKKRIGADAKRLGLNMEELTKLSLDTVQCGPKELTIETATRLLTRMMDTPGPMYGSPLAKQLHEEYERDQKRKVAASV